MDKDLRWITAQWLKANGYDGLYAPDECGCLVDDLMPCGEPSPQCAPGIKIDCTEEEHAEWACRWHVVPSEQEAERED